MRLEVGNPEHIKKVRRLTKKEQKEIEQLNKTVALLIKAFGGKEIYEGEINNKKLL